MRKQNLLMKNFILVVGLIISNLISINVQGQIFDPCLPPGPGCSSGPAIMMFSPDCGDTISMLQPNPMIFLAAMDSTGKVDTTFNGPANLSVITGPGSLTGNLNIAFNKGMAIFNGVNATIVGDYDVQFSGNTLPLLTCTIRFDTTQGGNPIGNCLGAGPTASLNFMNLPGNINVNSNFGFDVSAMNSTNCIDTTFTGTITVTKSAGPGNLIGPNTMVANKGTAYFNNLQFDQPGSYSLDASVSGLPNAMSMMINVNSGTTGGGGNCPPTSTQGARTNMGLYGGSSLDLTYNYTNYRLFAAISSPASLFYTDDSCKTWSRAFPDDSLEYGCGRGWGGRAVRVLSNLQGWVAVQTSQEAGTLNALVISYDGGNTWRTAMDSWMMNQIGFNSQNVSGMSLNDYHMLCLMGKYIVKVNNAGPVNPSTDITDITSAISGINSNSQVKGIAVGNNVNGYPYYVIVDTTGNFGANPSPVYRYDGSTFNALTLPVGLIGVTNIFTHPNQANADTIIIVGRTSSSSKMYRSFDAGVTWTEIIGPSVGFALSDVDYSPDWVASCPSSNGMVMIIPGSAMSTDLGDTWTSIGLENNGGAAHPNDINYVVGTMGRGVAVSTTGAAGPYSIANNYGLEAVQIKKIAKTASKSIFYLATRAGLAYTTAYTDTNVVGYDKWNSPYGMFPVPNVGDDAGISAVDIDPNDSLHVVAGYSNGFAVTTTGIGGFSNVLPSGWSTANMNPQVRDILFVNSSTVLAVTGGDNSSASGKGNIWRSTDGGASWTTVTPVGYTCGNSLAKGSINGNNVIYCGTGLSGSMSDPGTLWKSIDDGATWNQISYGPTAVNNPSVSNLPIYDIAVDPRGTDTLYLACGSNLDYAFAKSTDGGATFNNINATGEGAFTSVCINQTYPDSVYTAIRRDILVYDASTDSVMYIYRGLPGELVPDLSFGSVLAGTSMGFFKVEAEPLNTTGIKNIEANTTELFDVYPNPVSDEANFAIKASINGQFTLKVYDIIGNEIWSAPTSVTNNPNTKLIKMSTGDLSAGAYCVRMVTGSGHSSRIFIRIK